MRPACRWLIPGLLTLGALSSGSFAAEDPTVEKLLKKLPPPEKVVRPVQTALAQSDPALRDPIGRQIEAAFKALNIKRALALSRQLSAHYPQSFAAANVQGALAYFGKQYAESYSAFERAVKLEPKNWFAYLGLGIAAGAQDRYAIAADHFRQTTQLAPKYAPAWLYLSDCSFRIHNYAESAIAARKVAALAPEFYGGWWELARAEKALGHKKEAADAERRSRAALAQERRFFYQSIASRPGLINGRP